MQSFPYNQESFIEKCKSVNVDKSYDYSKVILGKYNQRVIVICPKHGEFTVIPYNHVKGKCQCSKCLLENYTTKINIHQRNSPEADIVPWLLDNNPPEEFYKINNFFVNEVARHLSCGLTPWYLPYKPEKFKQEYERLCKGKIAITNKMIYCLEMMEYFHRHLWFMNDEKAIKEWNTNSEKIINNRIKYCGINPRQLRRYFKITYMVPNLFQDSIARFMASEINGNTIYDPFAGFGARMLGTASLDKTYIGIDINKMTVNGNLGIIKELNLKNCEIRNEDSSKIKEIECDGCITSPPFFNHDIYDSTQTFRNKEHYQDFINVVFKNVKIKDKAIIDFKGVPGCTVEDFEKALPFNFIEKKKVSFGGMARNGSDKQSYHTWFYCKNKWQ